MPSLLPLDFFLHGIHLQCKGMQHFTLEILQHVPYLILDGCCGGRGIDQTLTSPTLFPSIPRVILEYNFDVIIG